MTIEFEGRMYRRLMSEDCKNLTGKKLLVCGGDFHEGQRALITVHTSVLWLHSVYIQYENNTPWGSAQGTQTFSDATSVFYISAEPCNEALCYCAGPSEERWCYDTNKIEPLCVRCRKRKEV